jgi:hypothetical protein
MMPYRPAPGWMAEVTGPRPVGVVLSTSSVSALRMTLVFASAVCTHSRLPSGVTRSMYGLLPPGKLTVLTMLRVVVSILVTVSWSRSGVKPNRRSGVK